MSANRVRATLDDGGMKTVETHVYFSHCDATRMIQLECGIEFVQPLDLLEPFEHPFYPWWYSGLASCRRCREGARVAYTVEDRERALRVVRGGR